MGWDEMILIFSNSLFLVGGKSILAHFMLHCSFNLPKLLLSQVRSEF